MGRSLVLYKPLKLSVLNNVVFLAWQKFFCTSLGKKFVRLLTFIPWYSPSEHAQRDPVHDEQQLLLALPRPLPERRHAQVSPYLRAVLRIRDVYPGSLFLPIPDPGCKNSYKRER